MQMKTRQIVVTLNLNYFHCVSLYSDCIHVVWIAFLMLTDKPTLLPPLVYKILGEMMSSYAAFNAEPEEQTGASTCRPSTPESYDLQ